MRLSLYLPLIASLLLVSGCCTDPAKYSGDLLYGPSKPPTLDARLMTLGPEFNEKLTSGDEESVLTYIKKLRASEASYRELSQAWITWFNKTFTKTEGATQ